MDYDEAMSFLEETKQYGSRPGLLSIRCLMRELGDIQEEIPVVHIAGTNGKGSVGAILSHMFVQSGYRVGWFNTPDVFSYEEEFRIGGEPIEKERLAELFGRIKEKCDLMVERGLSHPTRFEVETAAAFLWFFEEKCDVALIEVGMGGEGDATNLIKKPLASVLTPIDIDHTEFLGDTLEKIAAAKAGIIKPGCPVVSVRQKPEAERVIRRRCEEMEAPLYFSDAALHAPFREENASCARKTAEVLKKYYGDRFSDLDPGAAPHGEETVCWPGRYEQIGSDPCVILDGAHNVAAARQLARALKDDFPGKTFRYIMGVLADKDCAGMARVMFSGGERVWTVPPPVPRGLPAQTLSEVLKEQDIDAVPCETAREAVSYVLGEAKEDDVILVFGSLSFLGEIREAFRATPERKQEKEKKEKKEER